MTRRRFSRTSRRCPGTTPTSLEASGGTTATHTACRPLQRWAPIADGKAPCSTRCSKPHRPSGVDKEENARINDQPPAMTSSQASVRPEFSYDYVLADARSNYDSKTLGADYELPPFLAIMTVGDGTMKR